VRMGDQIPAVTRKSSDDDAAGVRTLQLNEGHNDIDAVESESE
jgi:hypothetical protein